MLFVNETEILKTRFEVNKQYCIQEKQWYFAPDLLPLVLRIDEPKPFRMCLDFLTLVNIVLGITNFSLICRLALITRKGNFQCIISRY